MEVSYSSTPVLVDLYPPVIVCKHLRCMVLNRLIIISGVLSPALAMAHIEDPYVRAGLIIVLYNSFAL